MIMYTEKEVEKLLKMQKKVCSDIASANWGNHVGKSVLKSPDVPLVKPCSLGSVRLPLLTPELIVDKWQELGEAYEWFDGNGEKIAMFSSKDVLKMMKELQGNEA